MNKNLFVIVLALVYARAQAQQFNIGLNLNPFQTTHNPIPMRDSIPTALVKPSLPARPVVVTKTVDTSASPIAIAAEGKIATQSATLESIKSPEGFSKKVLTSPKLLNFPNVKLLAPAAKKIVFDRVKEPAVPEFKPLTAVLPPKIQTDRVQTENLIEIEQDEYKMIHALLLLDFQKSYDTAMSLFVDLMKEGKFKLQAAYQYAEIAFRFGLQSEYRNKMMKLAEQTDDSFMHKRAVESLVKNAVALLPEDTGFVAAEAQRIGVNTGSAEYFLYRRGKQLLNQGELSQAISTLNSIPAQSKLLPQAKLLTATAEYRRGDVNAAIKALESAIPKLAADRSDKIRNLVYLTSARLKFQKGNYKEAYADFLQIDKSSSLWLQSTTEQALTQIMSGDYIGAAGNMFSLHTEFFKRAYAPDSYLIRSIGYLNLCQYGDAVSVVADLQRRYTKLEEQVTAFEKQTANPTEYYNLLKEALSKPEQNELAGVPRAYFLELARHPSFLKEQKRINDLEDELGKFNSVVAGLNSRSATIRQAMAQIRNDIKSLSAKKMTDLQIASLERRLLGLESELTIAAQGKDKIERMKIAATERVNGDKQKLKAAAAEALKIRFAVAHKKLSDVLEQKDVLAYEIYSGAGEHLRYQMAGGDTKDRSPAAALTPEEKQSYKWKFRGEVWEYEIGHYRSSLTNVCPKDDLAKNSGGK